MGTDAFAPQSLRSDRWALSITSPAPGVLCSVVSGHMELAAVKLLTNAYDQLAAAGHKVDAFHDWEGLTGYSSEAREVYTSWAKAHRDSVGSVSILVRSKLVAMGVSVANMVLGYLHAYSDRAAFERALARAVSARQRSATAAP